NVRCIQLITKILEKLYLKVDCRRLDLTNIKCTTFDKTFSDFEYCYLKAVNRTSKYISIKVLLLKTPIHHVLKVDCRRVEFTNIRCASIDKKFCGVDYCHIKAENRTYKHISLKVNLFKVPVRQFQVNLAFYKRSNGQSPLNYNFTVDGCKMIVGDRNPFVAFLFNSFKPYSNINHSCPYDHEIIVEKLPTHFIHTKFSSVWPIPEGDYVFSSYWYTSNVKRAYVGVHLSYT
ncbi:hypothetical protein KR018_002360, partial [Drosophila ironensis]